MQSSLGNRVAGASDCGPAPAIFHTSDESTGAVVGQRSPGGGRRSGENAHLRIFALHRSERSSFWPRTPGDSVQLQALLLRDA
jgi:hypothetical protein